MKTGVMAAAIAAAGLAGWMARSAPEAEAQSIDNKTTRWLAGSVHYGPDLEAFLLFDSQTHRLMAYTISSTKVMEVLAIRDVSYDLKVVSYGRQNPTVEKMKEDWDRAEREALRDKPKEPPKEPSKEPPKEPK